MTEQNFILLNALIKLSQRHLKEWETLAVIQRNVWKLVKHETATKLTFADTDKQDCFDLKLIGATQLKRIMVNQGQERQRLKVQHQEERALFNQLYVEPE